MDEEHKQCVARKQRFLLCLSSEQHVQLFNVRGFVFAFAAWFVM
ncbi:hypothetical protein HMPREF9514_00689 [Enterococcus faecalis TX0855]|nr:hypothetical protein HMPREF9514_00689 [Enterococcus faecalis TX0855]EFT44363.1 hypothetical protein HMPREF9500_01685 [Enterococcus faecalis TX0017]EPH72779.1 hypothetical protein D929_01818 [Enterococcus faecalis 02-MB-P-10]